MLYYIVIIGGMKITFFSTSFNRYFELLKQAFHDALHYPFLWIFAFLGAFLQSGSVLRDVLRSSSRLEPAGKFSIESIEAGITAKAPWLMEWGGYVLRQDELFLSATAVMALFAGIIALFVLLSGQQGLLFGATRLAHGKKTSFIQILNSLKHVHYLRLFSVNTFLFLTLLILFLLAAFPLSAMIDAYRPIFSLFVYTGFLLVLLPIAFFLHASAIFALFGIVAKDLTLFQAIKTGVDFVRTHLLIVFELSLTLFLVNVAVFSVVEYLIGLVLAPFAAVLVVSIAFSASSHVFLSITGLFLLLLTALLIYGVIIGFMVSFNHLVWAHLIKQSEKSGILSVLHGIFPKR